MLLRTTLAFLALQASGVGAEVLKQRAGPLTDTTYDYVVVGGLGV